MVQLALLVKQEMMERMDSLVLQVMLDLSAKKDTLVTRVQRAHAVCQARKEPKVHLDWKALQGHQVKMVMKDQQESLARQVGRAHQVRRGLLVWMERSDQWVFLDHQDLLDLQANQVIMEEVANWVLWDLEVCLENLAKMVHKVQVENMDLLGMQALQVLQVQQAYQGEMVVMARKAYLVQMDPRVIQGLQVSQARMVRLDPQVKAFQVRLGDLDCLVEKVTQLM
jgi:hypothetical protein